MLLPLFFRGKKVMKNILTGPFQVNTWIVPLIDNKVLVVDPAACDYTHDSTKIIDFIVSKGLEPVGFVLTHGHFDHITGCSILKNKWPAVKLACHEDDKSLIGKNAAFTQAFSLSYMGLENLVESLKGLPDADVYLKDGCSLDSVFGSKDNGFDDTRNSINIALSKWRVIHTPGHTQGSICLFNAEKKILISGDTVFYHSYGRTDLEGGSEAAIMNSLNKLIKTLPAETVVYPGHDTFGFLLGDNF